MSAPNALIAPFAVRMPAVLDADQLETWLTAPLGQAGQCLRPYPAAKMYVERTDERWPGAMR